MALAQPSVAGCWINDNSGYREYFAFYKPWPDAALMSHGDTVVEYSYNVRNYSFDSISISFYAEPIGHSLGVMNAHFTLMHVDRLVGMWQEGVTISLSRPPQLRPPEWCLMQVTTFSPAPVNTPAATFAPTPVPMPPITLPPAGVSQSITRTTTNTALENLNSNIISSAGDASTTMMTSFSAMNATTNAGSVSDTTPSSVNLGLIIGCVVGGVLCLIAVLILVALLLKNRAESPAADASVHLEDSRSSNVYGTVSLRMSDSDMGFPQSTGPPTIGTYSSASSNSPHPPRPPQYLGAKQLGIMQGNNDYQEMEIVPE